MSRPRKSEFLKLRQKHGMSISQAAEYFEVTERTVRNWDRDGAPKLAMRFFHMRELRLDSFHPAWKGFKISVNGKLYGPNRLSFSADYLRRWKSLLHCPSCDTNTFALVDSVFEEVSKQSLINVTSDEK